VRHLFSFIFLSFSLTPATHSHAAHSMNVRTRVRKGFFLTTTTRTPDAGSSLSFIFLFPHPETIVGGPRTSRVEVRTQGYQKAWKAGRCNLCPFPLPLLLLHPWTCDIYRHHHLHRVQLEHTIHTQPHVCAYKANFQVDLHRFGACCSFWMSGIHLRLRVWCCVGAAESNR